MFDSLVSPEFAVGLIGGAKAVVVYLSDWQAALVSDLPLPLRLVYHVREWAPVLVAAVALARRWSRRPVWQ